MLEQDATHLLDGQRVALHRVADERDDELDGFIKVSSAPMHKALEYLGK